jgi:hypothetical protein
MNSNVALQAPMAVGIEIWSPGVTVCSVLENLLPVSGVPRMGWGFGGFNLHKPPKFQSFDEAEPNSQSHRKYSHNNLIRTCVSRIYKLSKIPD